MKIIRIYPVAFFTLFIGMISWSGPAHLSAQKAGLGVPDVEEPIVDLDVAELLI